MAQIGFAGFLVNPAAIVARCVNGCVFREDDDGIEINAVGECYLCEQVREYFARF